MSSFIKTTLFRVLFLILLACACSVSADPNTYPDFADSDNRFGMLYSFGPERVDLAINWDTLFGLDLIDVLQPYVQELQTGWTREVTFVYTPGQSHGALSDYGHEKVATAQATGLKIIATIVADPNSYQPNPAAYQQWLAATVSNYQYDFEYWQIHNEVGKNGRYEIPFEYLSLLQDSYDAIRSISTDCKIMMGSTVPDIPYLTVLVNEGDLYVDAYDYHVFSETDLMKLETFASLISKPLFVTECGTYSNQPIGYPEQTQQQQASTLIQWFVQAFHSGADYVFWATMIEYYQFGNKPTDSFFDFFGLIYNGLCDSPPDDICNDPDIDLGPGERKEAFFAYKSLIRFVNRFESVVKIQDGLYRFIVNGKQVYVSWCQECVIHDMQAHAINADITIYTEPIPGDINGDSYVDYSDLLIFADQWCHSPGSPSADIALPEDFFVNYLDLTVLAEHWLSGTE